MPATIRRTRLSVFPEPAPASTSMLTSRRRSMSARWSPSGSRFSDIASEPHVGGERRVRRVHDLQAGALCGPPPAGPLHPAELAVGVLGAVDERARRDDVGQITEDVADRLPGP